MTAPTREPYQQVAHDVCHSCGSPNVTIGVYVTCGSCGAKTMPLFCAECIVPVVGMQAAAAPAVATSTDATAKPADEPQAANASPIDINTIPTQAIYVPPEHKRMGLTTEQLDNWFTYHEPRNETEVEAFKAIGTAFKLALEESVSATNNGVYLRANELGIKPGTPLHSKDFQSVFNQVNTALRNFVEVIDAHCPDSADKSAAIRCVRLARNAANEGIVMHMKRLQELPRHEEDWAVWLTQQLTHARWQASAAIACRGK